MVVCGVCEGVDFVVVVWWVGDGCMVFVLVCLFCLGGGCLVGGCLVGGCLGLRGVWACVVFGLAWCLFG